ncbi:NAD-dependent malic enzyme 59 kDa isoform, mitochondrial-like isoform X3 [Camellia sinensis]|uniref:NAD-dependent malic enzyme 59 kDa isoform, mitochondrial-like isoform X3 n=1 Tax=Camellia sinensis TaxID=4442 RepID=UPI0010359579|nr:NAD-dependent malic enzyme 59 kDa isoform, mitochondrial-like isoform X3 [Camellia sinensis]XP_028101642.1 NAD-dependent malic enzyme 59 kDa isoform, mitochondrial-like isoform X3 [Camellia sinensis]XP_028101650.1 NAD-dependent malic enzyme 59 kDa isoform, mitochondrial-like isoform X3 [Camellia sinensis]XP_028101657.1 NAD-dependent malic enzyme 59 kDa isoform, mitochondrial-like isoform X3 [Camellia sinensis]
MAAQTVSRMAGAEASPQFFLLDKDGLITTERKVVDPAAAPFAKAPGEIEGLGLREGANLVEMVKRVKPHVLLGLSGVEGIFNEQPCFIYYRGRDSECYFVSSYEKYLRYNSRGWSCCCSSSSCRRTGRKTL